MQNFLLSVELLVQSLPKVFVGKLLKFISNFVESSSHIEYYLIWVKNLLKSGHAKDEFTHSVLLTLNRNLSQKYSDLMKVWVDEIHVSDNTCIVVHVEYSY